MEPAQPIVSCGDSIRGFGRAPLQQSIGRAVTEDGAEPRPSVVRETANALRRDAIDRADGDLLGGEEELIRRYGVSRPTLRQAAALVAQEHLLTVKRGVGGGYFATRPDSRAVAHVAAVYLRSRKTRIAEVVRAMEPIRIELAKLAASATNPEVREELRLFLERDREISDDQLSYKDFLRAEREHRRLFGELSGNKVMALFLEILHDVSAQFDRTEEYFTNLPERICDYRSKRNRLTEAVLEGDVEMAVVASRRCALSAAEWMLEDLGGRSPGTAFLHFAGGQPVRQT
jgi:GntR family transcriptional repressor for pyruvate dehydrogenase complex